MTRLPIRFALALAIALPAAAWGPKTQVAIVGGGVGLVARETNVPLAKLQSEVRDGASVSEADMLRYIPNADISPLNAIETQISLLQSMRGQTLDPYFAFRMGILGKLVAQQTAPLREGDVTVRNQYYADVDANVDRTAIKPQPHRPIESRSYLASVFAEANSENELIEKEYEVGIGFDGLASATLAADISRSIHAVVDVWLTVLSGTPAAAAQSQKLDYALSGLQFAVDREHPGEIDRAYERLMAIAKPTAELRSRVGDLYFEAGLKDRAVVEYEALLRENPARSDIGKRVSEYYIAKGDSALETEALEDATDAYEKAIMFDDTNTDAHGKYNDAQGMIRARDERMAASQQAIDEAMQLRDEAAEAELGGNTAEAIARLFQAQGLYSTITSEFPKLASEARIGNSAVSIKITELKQHLVGDAESLSGSGSSTVAINTATTAARELDEDILRRLGEASTTAAIDVTAQNLANQYIN